jgi:hypothetical protein
MVMLRVIVLLTGIAIVGGIVAWGTYSEWESCVLQTAMMRKQHSFGFFQGCMVKTKDGWVSIHSYAAHD